MGIAVNASTLGMAIAGVLAAILASRVDRRVAITLSLAALAIPTTLLAHAPSLDAFFALRVVQGLLMATAFTLTLAHLGERCSAAASASAFAAYVTGNVASNLVGRLIAVSAVDAAGLEFNFYLFAALNLAGGLLVWATLGQSRPLPGHETMAMAPLATLGAHLRDTRLQSAFAIGFFILFGFIGVFTYVSFILVRPPFSLEPAALGLVFFVFAPSILTTPLAGRVVTMIGARRAMWLGLGGALAGLPMLLAGHLVLALAGLTLLSAGAFFAQAVATGYVSRTAEADRGAASGLYLSFYFLGGLIGTAVLGQAFDRFGWPGCIAGVALALLAAIALAVRLRERRDPSAA